jgi:hypothetical protein
MGTGLTVKSPEGWGGLWEMLEVCHVELFVWHGVSLAASKVLFVAEESE